jgi:hypothetical protein
LGSSAKLVLGKNKLAEVTTSPAALVLCKNPRRDILLKNLIIVLSLMNGCAVLF